MNPAEVLNMASGSCYYLDRGLVHRNAVSLLESFRKYYPKTSGAYSYKTNYTPEICRVVHAVGYYAEVVSAMEYEMALRLGVDSTNIIYNGPAKSLESLHKALDGDTIVNIDSLNELEAVLIYIGSRDYSGGIPRLVLRCSTDIGNERPSRFGFDVGSDLLPRAVSMIEGEGLELHGIHVHHPNRDIESYERRMRALTQLLDSLFHRYPPKMVNVGGGFMSRLPESLLSSGSYQQVTYDEYGELIGTVISKLFGQRSRVELVIEPGTAVVASVMKYFCRVLSTRINGNRHYCTVEGSMFNTSPYSRSRSLPIKVYDSNGNEKTIGINESPAWDIVGYTCIENDIIANGVLADINANDIVEIGNVGSYSVVMKPPFILPQAPIISHDDHGELFFAKERESVDSILSTFH